jgi:NAD(P)-dependent dehydrogenase (short-subunit alcohol dehydrogenase family)
MKTVLITGGSGKVGFQLINHFLEKDFRVITTTRDAVRFLENKKEELVTKGKRNLHLVEVDFTNVNAVNIINRFLIDNKLSIDSIIHNARSLDFLKIENDGTVTNENFAGEFYMDVIFPYRLTMDLNKSNSRLQNVIFISSIYGVVAPTPGLYEDFHSSSPIQYGVSKSAQIHLTKELAVRLGPEIRVNCVSFGGIKGRTNPNFEKKYSSLTPQQKMLNEDDVIGPVDFLLSEKSKNMTGQNLIIDGGWTIW